VPEIAAIVYQSFTPTNRVCARPKLLRRELRVTALDSLYVDLTVVLGHTHMPLRKLLRMGRGAVIALGAHESDPVEILANDHPIARGTVVVTGSTITVEVIEMIRKADVERAPGATFAGAGLAREMA
jgi:flagellar motor switch protein FliN/FliY